jgi:hypothetical protein
MPPGAGDVSEPLVPEGRELPEEAFPDAPLSAEPPALLELDCFLPDCFLLLSSDAEFAVPEVEEPEVPAIEALFEPEELAALAPDELCAIATPVPSAEIRIAAKSLFI